MSINSGQKAKSTVKNSVFVNGDDLGKTDALSKSKVLRSASGSYMNDAAALGLVDLVPQNDLVCKLLLLKLRAR